MLQINDQLRMQDVYRWDTIPVSRRQSVAEHTFNVIAIARAIAMGLDKTHHPNEFIRDVVCCAYDHDFEEAITGDVVSPTKRRMMKQGFDFNKEISLEFITTPSGYPHDVYKIVKIADTMEAVWFISENGRGRCGRHRASVMHDFMLGDIDELDPATRKSVRAVWALMMAGEFVI